MNVKPKPIGPAGKVTRDAIHGLIRIEPEDEVLLRLMDTPEFQRLRRIRQLGVSSFTYPGAEHSRFTHSLGVMNFAQRILESLRHRYRKDSTAMGLLKQTSRTLKAAALLQDVGHGPFSHMMDMQPPHRRERVDADVVELGQLDNREGLRLGPWPVAARAGHG